MRLKKWPRRKALSQANTWHTRPVAGLRPVTEKPSLNCLGMGVRACTHVRCSCARACMWAESDRLRGVSYLLIGKHYQSQVVSSMWSLSAVLPMFMCWHKCQQIAAHEHFLVHIRTRVCLCDIGSDRLLGPMLVSFPSLHGASFIPLI